MSPQPPEDDKKPKLVELPTSSTVNDKQASKGIIVDENTDENSLMRLMDDISDISYKGQQNFQKIKSSFSTEQKISTSQLEPIADVDCAPPSQELDDGQDQMSFSETDDLQSSSYQEPSTKLKIVKSQSSKQSTQSVEDYYIEPINPLDIHRPPEFYHPFAQQRSLGEKWQDFVQDCVESAWYFAYDIVTLTIEKLWVFCITIICLPILIMGLFLDKSRQLLRKCPQRQQNKLQAAVANKLQIVLAMDLTLVSISNQKPESKSQDYLVAHNEEFGGDIYIYLRPNLYQLLKGLQKLGTVSVFTAHNRNYANPILDKIDPQNKFFKNRFFSENCVKGSDGQLIKDMSVIQQLIDQNPQQPSLIQRILNRPQQIVNVMSSEIVVSRQLLERLVIIDDSITTYNAFKNNTIRVMQWYKSQTGDKCLMECLETVQQLSGTKDVTRDLQYIIDMKAKYRQ